MGVSLRRRTTLSWLTTLHKHTIGLMKTEWLYGVGVMVVTLPHILSLKERASSNAGLLSLHLLPDFFTTQFILSVTWTYRMTTLTVMKSVLSSTLICKTLKKQHTV